MRNYILLLLLLSCTSSSLVVAAEADMEDGSGLGKRKTPGNGTASNSTNKKHKGAEEKDDVEKWTHDELDEQCDSFSEILWTYLRSKFEYMKAQGLDTLDDNSGTLFEKGDTQIFPYKVIFHHYLQRDELSYQDCQGLAHPPHDETVDDQEGNTYFSCLYNYSKKSGCIFEFNSEPISVEDFNKISSVNGGSPVDIYSASGCLAGAEEQTLLRVFLNGEPQESYSGKEKKT